MRGAAELARLFATGVIPNAAYLGVGLWLLRPLGLRATGSERLALAYVFGTGASSLAILMLRLAGIPIPLPMLALVALAGLARLRTEAASPVVPGPSWARVVDGTTLALAVLTFVAALGPGTYWDGFEYHLPIAQAFSAGPIRSVPGLLDAEFRTAIDLLYIPAVAAGEPDAAAAVSACFAACLAAMLRAEARRRTSAGAAALAGLFTLLVPFTLDNAPSTYVDLGVGAYGFVALMLADRWNREGDAGVLPACAAAAAFAANAKLHALALIPALLALILLGGRRLPLRRCIGPALLAAGLLAPWLVKSAITTGNPFFPFLASLLGSGFATPEHLALRQLRLSTDFPTPGVVPRLLHYLLSLVSGRNPHVSLLVGALPLALAPLAMHRSSRATRALIGVLAALFVLQVTFMPALRFGAPLLPFVGLAAAVGGARLSSSGRFPRALLTAAIALLLVHHMTIALLRYAPRVAALRDPQRYEAAVFPDQAALREIVAGAEPVVAIPSGAVAWMPKPVYVLDWQRNGELFLDDVLGHQTPADEALSLLRKRGVRTLVLDVRPPLRSDGRLGAPTVDAWIARGLARVRSNPSPRHARGDRIWVQVDLIDAEGKDVRAGAVE